MSLREAINAKCAECIFDPVQPGTWRTQVEACTSPNCPLFEVRPRPYPKKGKSTPEEKALNLARELT